MHWEPAAAAVGAVAFVFAAGALLVAPTAIRVCGESVADPGGVCEGLGLAARSLVVGAGAFLAGALVAVVHRRLVDRFARRADVGPLATMHPRRR